MEVPLDFNAWIDLLENLLNYRQEILKLMTFRVLDFNEDNHICKVDLFAVMKFYHNEDDVFMYCFSHDFC